MTRSDHQAAFEELTAYLDGELAPAHADQVRMHLADCAECRGLEAELRGVSARLASWTVGDPPARLGVRSGSSSRRSLSRWLPLAAGFVLIVWTAAWWASRAHVAPSSPQVAAARPHAREEATIDVAASDASAELAYAPPVRVVPAAQMPLLARRASLSIVAPDFTAARAEMERIVSSAGGFTGNIVASSAPGSGRSLQATLQIPAAALDATVEALKRLGRVSRESRDAEDVTRQSADLDARLANARVSEQRLKDILGRRTGDLADVLSVEREIARVRGEIEGMEADRKGLDGRITYATVSLELAEEQKAAMHLGPVPVSIRLRNAFVEGWRGAAAAAIETAIVLVRVTPTLLLLALVLAFPARWVGRRWFDNG